MLHSGGARNQHHNSEWQAYYKMRSGWKNYQYACDIGGKSPFYLSGLCHIQGISDQKDKALKTIEKLKTLKENCFNSSLDLALAGMGITKENETLDLIKTGIEERVSLIPYIFVDPRFNKFVSDDLLDFIDDRKI